MVNYQKKTDVNKKSKLEACAAGLTKMTDTELEIRKE